MARHSAGLLPFRYDGDDLHVFIAHMGGPFWARKQQHAWSIVKGEYEPGGEEPEAVARREFFEEIGVPAPEGDWLDLGSVRQSGKVVAAFAVRAPASLAFVASNTVEVEWPPRSGRLIEVPEVDRAEWMPVDVARTRLVKGQIPLLDRLVAAT